MRITSTVKNKKSTNKYPKPSCCDPHCVFGRQLFSEEPTQLWWRLTQDLAFGAGWIVAESSFTVGWFGVFFSTQDSKRCFENCEYPDPPVIKHGLMENSSFTSMFFPANLYHALSIRDCPAMFDDPVVLCSQRSQPLIRSSFQMPSSVPYPWGYLRRLWE